MSALPTTSTTNATPLYSARMASTVPNGIKLVKDEATVFSMKDLLQLYKLGASTSVNFDNLTSGSNVTRYTEWKRYFATDLPAGLACDVYGNVTGTPTDSGEFTALVEVVSTTYTINANFSPAQHTYLDNGTCFIGVQIIVEDAPTGGTIGDPPADSKILFDNQTLTAGASASIQLQSTGTYSTTWRVSGLPPGMSASSSYVSGTPTTPGEYLVTIQLTYNTSYNDPYTTETRVFMFTVTQGVPVINAALFNSSWGGSGYYYPIDIEVGSHFALQLSASGSPTSWAATGLPPGLSINSTGLIAGIPTIAGRFMVEVMATNSIGTSAPFVVLLNLTEPALPKVLAGSGIDLFFDIQSRELTLNAPKAEQVLSEGSSIRNEQTISKLLIKNGETLQINLRFLKGGQVIDPDATGIRFGVASRPGAPLLLDSSSFTKVGTGSMTYHSMYVSVSSDEFASLLDTYFDDDAVENVEHSSDDTPTMDAVCEVELTTGIGPTLAKLKSSSLEATIMRSIF
jgi:hypothetical protein